MSPKSIVSSIIGGVVAILLLSAVFGGFYTIDQSERGVQLRNGAITGIAQPGLNFKTPFVDSVEKISVQTFTIKYENLDAYSKDQQPAKLKVSVSFRVPESAVSEVYTTYGGIDKMADRLVNRQVPSKVENVFGQYNAVLAVQHRPKLEAEIGAAIKAAVIGPVVIESVQVENIDFDESYEQSIRDRMKAEVAVQTANQTLEKEKVNANIAVTQAQAQADSSLARAKADAESTKLRGDAEASAIKAKAEALAKNQDLVELTKAEKWDGKLPTTVIPGNATPFLSVGK